jgi:hypothetical protein
MALWTLGKAPFSAIFRPVFARFLRVFSARWPIRAQMGAHAIPQSAGSSWAEMGGGQEKPLELTNFGP